MDRGVGGRGGGVVISLLLRLVFSLAASTEWGASPSQTPSCPSRGALLEGLSPAAGSCLFQRRWDGCGGSKGDLSFMDAEGELQGGCEGNRLPW